MAYDFAGLNYPLGKVPGTDHKRFATLQKAAVFFRDDVLTNEVDDIALKEAGLVFYQCAITSHQMSNHTHALQWFYKASETYSALRKRGNTDINILYMNAHAENATGSIIKESDTTKALTHLTVAIELGDTIKANPNANASCLEAQAMAYYTRSQAYNILPNRQQAIADAKQAIAIRSQMVSTGKASPEVVKHLAGTFLQLAKTLDLADYDKAHAAEPSQTPEVSARHVQGQVINIPLNEEAKTHRLEALRLLRKLDQERPHDEDHKRELANGCMQYAQQLGFQGPQDEKTRGEIDALYREGLSSLESLVKRFPTRPEYMFQFVSFLSNTAREQFRRGEFRKATEAVNRTVELHEKNAAFRDLDPHWRAEWIRDKGFAVQAVAFSGDVPALCTFRELPNPNQPV